MKRNSQFCDLDNADSANHEEIANGLPRLKRFCNWIVVVFLLVGSAVYTAHFLPRSWAPEDEGTLAQPALRVLEGQLPHRDFDDVYTGGEAFLNAAAFRIFGIRLISMRY